MKYLIGSKIDEVRIDGSLVRLRKDMERFASIGIGAVELPVHGLDAIRNGVLDNRRLKAVLDIMRDFDFAYSIHSPNPLNLMDRHGPELHISVFRSSLEFAAAVGARVLVYHAGRYIPEETFPVNGEHRLSKEEKGGFLETERQRLSRLADEYPEVVICVENARPYLYHSPYCYAERLDLLYEQIRLIDRANVRINLDIGHLFMASRFYHFDSVPAVQNLKDSIAHTHVHDNFGGCVFHHEKQQTHQLPFGRGDSHMPVGWGAIPIADILSAYLQSYHGMLMMELRSRYFHDVQESRDNLIQILECIAAKG